MFNQNTPEALRQQLEDNRQSDAFQELLNTTPSPYEYEFEGDEDEYDEEEEGDEDVFGPLDYLPGGLDEIEEGYYMNNEQLIP